MKNKVSKIVFPIVNNEVSRVSILNVIDMVYKVWVQNVINTILKVLVPIVKKKHIPRTHYQFEENQVKVSFQMYYTKGVEIQWRSQQVRR